MTISERMFDEMAKRGKRPADLCKILGVGTAQTTAWKRRNADPPSKYIKTISEFLGCSCEYLLTGEDSIRFDDALEADIIRMYRELSQTRRETILDSIKAAYVREMDERIANSPISQEKSS